MEKAPLVPVGKAARTHGVRGAVLIYPYGEGLSVQEAGVKLFLQSASQSERSALTLVSLKPHGRMLLAQFQELNSIEQAQEIVGQEVFLPQDSLPPTSEGEYYHYQLIGLVVETKEGKAVGTLRSIIETPGSDVYVLDHQGKEVLIPAVDEVICEIDLTQGRMVIDPPEGLIDDL